MIESDRAHKVKAAVSRFAMLSGLTKQRPALFSELSTLLLVTLLTRLVSDTHDNTWKQRVDLSVDMAAPSMLLPFCVCLID